MRIDFQNSINAIGTKRLASRTVPLFVLGMGILVLISFLATFLAGNYALEAALKASQHENLSSRYRAVLASIVQVESGQRGYVLTRDPEYLFSYNEAKNKLDDELRRAETVGRKLGIKKSQLDEIRETINEKLNEMGEIIRAENEEFHSEAVDLVKSKESLYTMNHLKEQIDGLISGQDARVVVAQGQLRAATNFRTITFGLIILICFVALIYAGRSLQQEALATTLAMEETVRQRKALEVTLQSIGDGIIVTDSEGKVRFLNPVAERLTGWKTELAQGLTCGEVFKIRDELTGEPIKNPELLVMESGEDFGNGNNTILIRKDGTEVPIDDSGAPIRDESGRFFGVVLVFRDFTHRKDYEQSLLHARKAAEEASAAKDKFLASLSHELRTPLTPVVAMLSVWKDDPDFPENYKEGLDVLQRCVNLEARIIDDLLDLTQITQGKLSLHHEVLNIRDLIQKTIQLCSSEIHAKELLLETRLDDSEAFVVGDHARLQQVILNILRNAIKFSEPGGKITVESKVEDDEVHIQIADEGIGMSTETLKKLFEPFEQGENVTKAHRGLGLGMAISRELVNAHKGIIIPFSNGPDMGSKFTVILPTAQPTEHTQGVTESQVASPTCNGLNVLLVEDHLESAVIFAKLLKSKGHNVQTADSIASALDCLQQQEFHVLLSDIGLPDGTGYDLLTQVQERFQKQPLAIALSGYGMEEDIQKSMQVGFAHHLTKPINFQRLENIFNQIPKGQG
jgi:PAS domain S-box-containing protein